MFCGETIVPKGLRCSQLSFNLQYDIKEMGYFHENILRNFAYSLGQGMVHASGKHETEAV